MEKLKYDFKILFDQTAVLIITIAGYGILFGGLILKYCSIAYPAASVGRFKSYSMPFAYFHFALIGVISLLYFSVEERVSLEEALTNDLKIKRDRGKAAVLLLFNGLVFLFVFLTVFLFYRFKADPSMVFLSYFKSLFYREFLDYFLLGTISALFGYLIAQAKKKKYQFVCYFLYQFIFGMPMLWLSHNFAFTWTNNAVIKFILNMTSMMPDGYQYQEGTYHIYPVQLYQIVLAFFWITVLLWSGMLCYKKEDTKRIVKWGGCLLWVVLFALCMIPHTQIGGGERNLSPWRKINDQAYTGTIGREMENAPFEVNSYDITINAFLNLYATVEAEVSDSALNQYTFTLYDGYYLLKVEDQSGKAMAYDRDGHYLTVFSSGETSVIRFTYAGAGEPFYCEAYEIWLPSGIPFYPMAGKVPIYDDNENNSNMLIFNNNHLPQDTFFHVKVNALGEVYCPLERIGRNEFSGCGDGFFVLNGMYDKVTYGDIEIIYPYAARNSNGALDEEQVRDSIGILKDRIGEGVLAPPQNLIFIDCFSFSRMIDTYANYITVNVLYSDEAYQRVLDDYLEEEGVYYDYH